MGKPKPGTNSRERYPHLYEMKVCPVCKETKLIHKKQLRCSHHCALLGNKRAPGHPGGALHPSWKGDDIGYAAAHKRVEAARGRACEHVCKCGKPAKDWANLTGNYTDVEDYEAMCRTCHRALDKRRRLSVGDGSG